MSHTWSISDVPSQNGKIAIVTGTGGLGYETALVLAQKGAQVILAGRNPDKGQASVKRILSAAPGSNVRFEFLDLASLSSISDFSERFTKENSVLDLLINNAGVMAPANRKTTQDGFELQLGTNYLGHFALTARLLPLLNAARATRVVNLSSIAHRNAKIFFEDLQVEKKYHPWSAYGQSKLAMLVFAFELHRRSESNGWKIMSTAAHPGYARTDLIANGPGNESFLSKVSIALQPWLSHSAAQGALSILYAATSPDAKGGEYYGPDWFFELKGAPRKAKATSLAKDPEVGRKLWNISEQLVGFPFNKSKIVA